MPFKTGATHVGLRAIHSRPSDCAVGIQGHEFVVSRREQIRSHVSGGGSAKQHGSGVGLDQMVVESDQAEADILAPVARPDAGRRVDAAGTDIVAGTAQHVGEPQLPQKASWVETLHGRILVRRGGAPNIGSASKACPAR